MKHGQCDARPTQTFPATVSPPNGRYQFILLGEQRHIVCEQLARLKPATSQLQIRLPNHYATPHKLGIWILEIVWFVDWKVKGQGNEVNKFIYHRMTITPMLTDNSNTAWVWTLSAFYRVAQKRGHPISLQIFWKLWPNCMEICELLQYYMINTVINFLFENFIALWRHLAKTPLPCDAQYLFVQCE